MPSVSSAQHRLWGWAKSNPAEAAKRGIKPDVAEEFLQADKGRKFPKRRKVRNALTEHATEE